MMNEKIKELIIGLENRGIVFLYNYVDIEKKISLNVYDVTRFVESWAVRHVDEWCMNLFLSDPLNWQDVSWFGVNDRIYLRMVRKLWIAR